MRRQRLSPREIDVLQLAAGGLHNYEIVRELGISDGAVRKYLRMASLKLKASSRVQAVALARLAGEIS